MKAAVLAIGTELSTGEIVNTNGAWLGDRLQDLGFEVTLQLIVPDDRPLIQKALNWLSESADVIVVSGGLGPTSDDFTREEIAQWLEVELDWSETVWQEMQSLYQQRGLTIRPAHRQQCYFPKDSHILNNPVGTAHGFAAAKGAKRVVVLPGPPREISGMWDPYVVPQLKALGVSKKTELKIWTLLGVTESEAAEITEQVIQGHNLQVGYRATIPYVKVKLWIPVGSSQAQEVCTQLEDALKKWIVARDQSEPLDEWLKRLAQERKVVIEDLVTQGRLGARIDQWREKGNDWPQGLSLLTSATKPEKPIAADCLLSLKPGPSDREFEVSIQRNNVLKQEIIALPFKVTASSRRGSLYLVELAIQWWLKNL